MRVRILASNNDCHTGRPKGNADHIEIVLGEDSDAFLSLVGSPIRCHLTTDNGKPNFLLLGNLSTVKVLDYHPHFGNLCWNSFDVSIDDALKSIRHLQRRKWHCESGWYLAYEKFNKRAVIDEHLMRASLI